MIIKSFEVNKINHKEIKNFLFYGENAGLKKELIEKKFKNDFKNKIYTYEESEILKNEKIFFDQILTRSFFENDKLLIISRATDKIEKIVSAIARRLENSGESEIKTSLIGEYIMEALSNLDQVAYVRFASVYKNFREVKDFEDFLGNLEDK